VRPGNCRQPAMGRKFYGHIRESRPSLVAGRIAGREFAFLNTFESPPLPLVQGMPMPTPPDTVHLSQDTFCHSCDALVTRLCR
jgi:hypothetical protein